LQYWKKVQCCGSKGTKAGATKAQAANHQLQSKPVALKHKDFQDPEQEALFTEELHFASN
jgi:hypothetical protein